MQRSQRRRRHCDERILLSSTSSCPGGPGRVRVPDNGGHLQRTVPPSCSEGQALCAWRAARWHRDRRSIASTADLAAIAARPRENRSVTVFQLRWTRWRDAPPRWDAVDLPHRYIVQVQADWQKLEQRKDAVRSAV